MTSIRTPQRKPSLPILIIDDDENSVHLMTMTLRVAGFTAIVSFVSSTEALEWIKYNQFDAVVLDIVMPGVSGIDVLSELREQHPDIPVIMATGMNDLETAIACMKKGAYDYIVKPVESERLITSVTNAVKLHDLQRSYLRLSQSLISDTCENPDVFAGIKTDNQHMQILFRYCEAVSRTRYPVLITGETGTGKELFARAIHASSGVPGDFVPINVAGLDDMTFSDTLFGHTKGAFTGADSSRPGLVETAANGTLFLDEIGDLAPQAQVKLLRILQEEEYLPLGSDTTRKSSCRIIAATNISLAEHISKGVFRSDLYYRLHMHHITIPPLRERKEDIPLLLEWFITQSANEMNTKIPIYPPELISLLATYPFPGNIRELEGMVREALLVHKGGILSTGSFRKAIGLSERTTVPPPSHETDTGVTFHEKLPTLRQVEQALVKEAFSRAKGNQSIAASLIGITRQSFAYRLKKDASSVPDDPSES